MIKYLALLYSILLFSNTLCLDCTDDKSECNKEGKENADNLVCVPVGDTCRLLLYCNILTTKEDNTECSDYPTKENGKKCFDNDETGASNPCKEEYPCNDVPSLEDGKTCESYPVTDKTKYHCVSRGEGANPPCMQQYLCEQLTKADKAQNSDISCSALVLSKENRDKGTHMCIEDKSDATKACKEVKICSKVASTDTDKVCSHYAVEDDKKVCVGKTGDDNQICQEIYSCNNVPAGETGACENFIVSDNDHICVEGGTKCTEKTLCEAVKKADSVKCSDFPVKIANKDTHGCIESKNPEKACQEEKFCEKNTEGTSDEICRRNPVTKDNIGKKACIKKENSMGCEEKELCETVTKGTDVDCSKYPVKDENVKTHLCAEGSDDKCAEVEILCSTAEKGENDEQCSFYKVSGSTKRCVKNTDTSTGAKPCKEVEKSACELKTSGATDDSSCKDLAVYKTGEQICKKNPDKDSCVQLFYCEYGTGLDDNDCTNYALKDTNKECKKKADENKCEEVEKNDGGNGGNKGSKGSFLNVKVGLLLIISLL